MSNNMKNDFQAILNKKKPILEPEVSTKRKAKPTAIKRTSRPVGHKRKPESEQVTERVQTLLTKQELINLKKRAGDSSVSRYIRKALKKAGEL